MRLFREDTHEPVKLPASLTNFRGEQMTVWEIAADARAGSAGKVLAGSVSDPRMYFPGVFRCYIADEPREAVA